MRIESLKTTPDRAGRYWVVFEDGTKLPLYRQTVEDFGLYPGKEFTDEEMAVLKKSAGEMSAKMRAVRIVAASSVSKRDLEYRLVQKGEDPKQAKDAVEWMSDLNLLDDAKTAEQIVGRCIRKGYGLARAKQALYEKRIPKEFWEDALADYPDQTESITEYLRAHLKPGYEERELRKATDALLRRGHNYQQIRKAMQNLSQDVDLWEEY